MRKDIAALALAASLVIIPLFVKPAKQFINYYINSSNKNWSSPSTIIAIITAVIALGVGAFQVWLLFRQASISERQAAISKRQADIAFRTHLATHRPKLVLRQAFSLINDPEEATIVVQYVLANVGGSGCWMTECHLGIQVVASTGYPIFFLTAEHEFPSHVPFIGEIPPGQQKNLTFADKMSRWTNANRKAFQAPGGIHFVGHIAYIDEPGSGIIRRMAFRRRYDIDTQRFRQIPGIGDENEYSD